MSKSKSFDRVEHSRQQGIRTYKNKTGIFSEEFLARKNQSEMSKKAIVTMREKGTGIFKHSEKREKKRVERQLEVKGTCDYCGRTLRGNIGIVHLKKCVYSNIPMKELSDINISAYSLMKKYGVPSTTIHVWRNEML